MCLVTFWWGLYILEDVYLIFLLGRCLAYDLWEQDNSIDNYQCPITLLRGESHAR